ncbi:MAG TPA: cell division protein FtsA [Fervidobacterium sp.]|nr:cell division protein FtsA [Fervidobacterium sp.]HQE47972.1 cell division protein FtsA [Fervidobacterium sp.]HUM41461.1 cell division protein FtsA [Fervidobacterium sp.]
MPKVREIVSLDIGNDSIKGIVVDYSEGYGNVVAFSNVKTRGIESGEIKDVVALNESMNQIIEDLEEQTEKELKGDLLVSSSCGDFTLTELTEELFLNEKEENYISEEHVNKLTDNLLSDVFQSNEKNSLHLFVKKYVLDDTKIVVNPIGMKAKKVAAVYTIVMGNESYKNVVEYATKDILGEAEYYISFISTAEAVLSNVEKDRGVLHVDLGYNTTSVTLYYANTPLELQRMDIAMKNVIRDIAVVLKTSIQEAERLLRTYGIAMFMDVEPTPVEYKGLDGRSLQRTNKEFLSRIIYARLREIFMKVKKVYKDITIKYPEFSDIGIPGGIVLTGGGAMLQRVESLAGEVFRCPVRIGILSDLEKFQFEEDSAVSTTLFAPVFGNILVYQKEQNVYSPLISEKSRKQSPGFFKKISDAFGKIFG